MTIWKFTVPVTDEFSLDLPEGARLLTVQVQAGAPRLWALVDSERPTQERRFQVVGTGHRVTAEAAEGTYVGTFQLHDGALVFHLFDLGEYP